MARVFSPLTWYRYRRTGPMAYDVFSLESATWIGHIWRHPDGSWRGVNEHGKAIQYQGSRDTVAGLLRAASLGMIFGSPGPIRQRKRARFVTW